MVVALLWLIRKKEWGAVAGVAAILVLEMSHGTVGFTQFGYRFALDVYPLLYLGVVAALKEKRLRILMLILGVWSIVVNAWGYLAFANDWFRW